MQSVPIILDRVRNVRIGINAMRTIKSLLKKPLEKVDLNDMDELLTVLMVGLQHEDSGITQDKLANLIDEHSDIETAMEVTTDAILEAYGKNAKAAANAAKEKLMNSLKAEQTETEEETETEETTESEVNGFQTLT